jgi:hypothetical protein
MRHFDAAARFVWGGALFGDQMRQMFVHAHLGGKESLFGSLRPGADPPLS